MTDQYRLWWRSWNVSSWYFLETGLYTLASIPSYHAEWQSQNTLTIFTSTVTSPQDWPNSYVQLCTVGTEKEKNKIKLWLIHSNSVQLSQVHWFKYKIKHQGMWFYPFSLSRTSTHFNSAQLWATQFAETMLPLMQHFGLYYWEQENMVVCPTMCLHPTECFKLLVNVKQLSNLAEVISLKLSRNVFSWMKTPGNTTVLLAHLV